MGTLSDIAMLKKVKSFEIDVITVDSEDKEAGFAVTDKGYVVPKVKDAKYIDAKEIISSLNLSYNIFACLMQYFLGLICFIFLQHSARIIFFFEFPKTR